MYAPKLSLVLYGLISDILNRDSLISFSTARLVLAKLQQS